MTVAVLWSSSRCFGNRSTTLLLRNPNRGDHPMRPSITPVEPPFDDDVSELLAQMTGSESREPLLLFRTLARNVPLATAWSTLGAYNLRRGRLPVRDRELIILR